MGMGYGAAGGLLVGSIGIGGLGYLAVCASAVNWVRKRASESQNLRDSP